jgi:hypothetical protein
MELAVQALIDECKRQDESCLYTSTALFEWLKYLRRWRKILITTPIILSAIAASAMLGDSEEFKRDFRANMKMMDDLRLASPAVPDRFFAKAPTGKSGKGHYDFAVDAKQHRSRH